MSNSNLILIGKVTGILFEMLDAKTAEAPTEKTEERDHYFHTIYDIDVITSYKGDASHITTVRLMGGIIGSFEDEQYALQAKYNKTYIPVFEGNPEYKVGETYLFVLYKFETGAPTPLNIDQKGNPIMSAMDVISALGQDKWDTFWSQWQI